MEIEILNLKGCIVDSHNFIDIVGSWDIVKLVFFLLFFSFITNFLSIGLL